MSSKVSKVPTYQILLIGDEAVGKTTFITRHRTVCFEKNYQATDGVKVHPLKFNTNKGPIILNIWDVSGQDISWAKGTNGVIIMFDLTRRQTYKNVSKWHKNLNKTALKWHPNIIIVGNKSDVAVKIKPRYITYHRKKSLAYTEVSAKSNYHFDKPFLYFAKRFLGQDTCFVAYPTLSQH